MGNAHSWIVRHTTKQSFPFLRLPVEIQWKIVKYLSCRDYQALCQALPPFFYTALERPLIKTSYTIHSLGVYREDFGPLNTHLEIIEYLVITLSRFMSDVLARSNHELTILGEATQRGDICAWSIEETTTYPSFSQVCYKKAAVYHNCVADEYIITLFDAHWTVYAVADINKFKSITITDDYYTYSKKNIKMSKMCAGGYTRMVR